MIKDIELLDSGSILKGLRFPHKIKDVTQIVITAGQFSCRVVSKSIPSVLVERLTVMSYDFSDKMT